MARAQATDFFSVFRYKIVDLESGKRISGGFSNVTLPEQEVEAIEYSEGTRTYSLYQPGRSRFGTCTLSRGVILSTTQFARWIRQCAEGRDYSMSFEIHHFHREDLRSTNKIDFSDQTASRKIKLINCMPIRFRPGSDLDALSSDIMIEEIEVQPEQMIIYNGTEEIGPDSAAVPG